MLYRFGRSKICFHAVVCRRLHHHSSRELSWGKEKLVVKSHSKPYPTFGKLESNDPRFDKLISPGAKMEKLGEGFEWCEGPVWSKEGGFLLFSDIPRNSVMKWKDGEGVSLYMKPSGFTGIVDYGREPGSNANTFDSQGRLTQCEHGDRRISVLTKERRQTDAGR